MSNLVNNFILNLLASRCVRNQCLLIINYPIPMSWCHSHQNSLSCWKIHIFFLAMNNACLRNATLGVKGQKQLCFPGTHISISYFLHPSLHNWLFPFNHFLDSLTSPQSSSGPMSLSCHIQQCFKTSTCHRLIFREKFEATERPDQESTDVRSAFVQ